MIFVYVAATICLLSLAVLSGILAYYVLKKHARDHRDWVMINAYDRPEISQKMWEEFDVEEKKKFEDSYHNYEPANVTQFPGGA